MNAAQELTPNSRTRGSNFTAHRRESNSYKMQYPHAFRWVSRNVFGVEVLPTACIGVDAVVLVGQRVHEPLVDPGTASQPVVRDDDHTASIGGTGVA